MATAETLKATHSVNERVRDVAAQVVGVDDRVAGVDNMLRDVNETVTTVNDRVQAVDDKVTEGVKDAQVMKRQSSLSYIDAVSSLTHPCRNPDMGEPS